MTSKTHRGRSTRSSDVLLAIVAGLSILATCAQAGEREHQAPTLYVTFDPERDTPEHLKAYLEHFSTVGVMKAMRLWIHSVFSIHSEYFPYFQGPKTCCGFKNQASARPSHE